MPEARHAARLEIRDFAAWHPVITNSKIIESGWVLQDRYGLSFWDALMVPAAKACDCDYLLTEDFQAGQKIDNLEIVNRFQKRFDELI